MSHEIENIMSLQMSRLLQHLDAGRTSCSVWRYSGLNGAAPSDVQLRPHELRRHELMSVGTACDPSSRRHRRPSETGGFRGVCEACEADVGTRARSPGRAFGCPRSAARILKIREPGSCGSHSRTTSRATDKSTTSDTWIIAFCKLTCSGPTRCIGTSSGSTKSWPSSHRRRTRRDPNDHGQVSAHRFFVSQAGANLQGRARSGRLAASDGPAKCRRPRLKAAHSRQCASEARLGPAALHRVT